MKAEKSVAQRAVKRARERNVRKNRNLHMKTINPSKNWLPLIVATALVALAQLSSAEAPMHPHSTEQGVSVRVWYQAYCDLFTPGVGPYCMLARPYSGTFTIFTRSGRRVARATTDFGSFTVPLKAGRYLIVPDDPLLVDAIRTVTVRAKKFTDVMTWIERRW